MICGKPVDISDWVHAPPSPTCVFEAGHDAEHPCAARQELPGEPCRYCGKPVTTLPCGDCWTPMPDNLADQKALLAKIGLSVDKQ